MSLVHEALQKAEREKQRKLGTTPPTPHPTPPQPHHYEPPAVSAPIAGTAREPVARQPDTAESPAPSTKEPNHFLLPALIGCVAIVAIIAIVFIVSSVSSVLQQSKNSSASTAVATVPTPVAKSVVRSDPLPPEQSPTQVSAQVPDESPAPPPIAPPPPTPAADGSKFTLSGIMLDPDGKYVAIINGHVTYEGTVVGGATVKSIDREHAVLDVNGHEMPLRLF